MFAKSAYLRTVVLLVENTRVLRGVVSFFSHFYTPTDGCANGHFNGAVGLFFVYPCERWRGEAPKGLQPRVPPWGVSELSILRSERAAGGSSLATLPIPFALSERRIAIPFLPRASPWAVFLLGFQPVFARNHDCCTILCAIFLLGFQPVFARNHDCCIILCATFLLGFRSAFSGRSIVCKK